ncbi:MAG: 4-(cytidine 5'-diphospho)-2-C-methyl-D-erythritol kinase [Clostridiales bacterium]|nr:4-(cytidine 5'-diphospho)-2-C-methyl-D-erythritol kinase [Clostridiales bacterium]
MRGSARFVAELRACAKINLTLNVTGKRTDGYHELESVMQSVSLCDDVTVTVTAPDADARSRDCRASEADAPRIRLTIEPGRGFPGTLDIPADGRNTAYRAALEFLRETGLPFDVAIHIRKRIPVAAGLAGGSADAAAVLRALNGVAGQMDETGGVRLTSETGAARRSGLVGARLTAERLRAVGARVGADVPFCLSGGAALATGIGERLRPLPPLPPGLSIVLANPGFAVSTAWVFGRYSLAPGQEIERLSKMTHTMIQSLEENRIDDFWDQARGSLFNVLESVAIPAFPAIGLLKENLRAQGAHCALMSGSGATVFALFKRADIARAAARGLRRKGGWALVCQAVPGVGKEETRQ